MARKKKSPSNAKTKAETDVSKAQAISGAVKDAEFDTPDAAMADTSLEPGDTADTGDTEADVAETAPVDVADAVEAEDVDTVDVEQTQAEPEMTQTSEPEPDADETPAAMPPPEQKSGFFGTVLGGVVAAVIGFGGAVYFGAADWPVFGGTAREEVMEAKIAEQADQLAVLASQIGDLTSALEKGQAADAAAFADVTERLDALPTTTAELMPDDLRALLAAQKEEMDVLQANLDKMAELTEGQIASAQAQQESAAAAEARAKARGALNAVRNALSGGGTYAAALPDIAAATEVPEVLHVNADSGVPTAEALEDGFGEAARAALSASLKATAGDAPSERLALFLKDQLGARSLTPREGDDPDAVLSRAEAAVRAGDLDGALETLSALPEEGQAALSAWTEDAITRKDALAAFDSLADALSAN